MKGLTHPALKPTASLLMVVVSLPALSGLAGTRDDSHAYSRGTITCLEGDNGPGLALFLGTDSSCVRLPPSYPYVEIDIRERPVPIGKVVTIGPENWAFQCRSSQESCEQALSGRVVFDHSADPSSKGAASTGHYELKFKNGRNESGDFEVVCSAPCG